MKMTLRFAMLIATAALLLSACIPTPAGNDGATIDATQAAQMIEDAVNKALDAQATENAANMPAATATLPPATVTAIPAPATETPIPTVTAIVLAPTATVAPASGGGTYTTPAYYCEYNQGKQPKDNTKLSAGDAFDIKFTIVNRGTATWIAGTDVKYGYNTDLTNGGTSRTEIPVALAPGESYVIGPFDAWAPAQSGHYVMGFIVEGVGNCTPYVAIDVK
jgi:hypothetical protein